MRSGAGERQCKVSGCSDVRAFRRPRQQRARPHEHQPRVPCRDGPSVVLSTLFSSFIRLIVLCTLVEALDGEHAGRGHGHRKRIAIERAKTQASPPSGIRPVVVGRERGQACSPRVFRGAALQSALRSFVGGSHHRRNLGRLPHSDAYWWSTQQGARFDLILFQDGKREGVEIQRTNTATISPSVRIA